MHPLIAELLAVGPVLTDGAWGTQMQARGLVAGEFPDGWNLLHPDRVAAVARAYADAGSRVVLTNTFGSNRVRLMESELGPRVRELNEAGVRLSREGVGGRARVFASIGPAGKMLLTGEVTEEQLLEAFTEQASALASAGADALVVETMSDLAEATVAIRAAKATGLPVVACMVFDTGREQDRTMMGDTPERVARVLTEAGADVVGANCGQGVAGFVKIAARLRSATDRPLWIKANAGLPEMVDGEVVYRTTADEFAAVVPGLIAAGAAFVGGCCGTSPEFIRACAGRVR
jgi:methionine synthase I (cobalamin-dependent)